MDKSTGLKAEHRREKVVDERFEYYNRRRRHSSNRLSEAREVRQRKTKSGEKIDPKPWPTLALKSGSEMWGKIPG